MKKSIYAFLIVAIVVIAIVLAIVKYPKVGNQDLSAPAPIEVESSEDIIVPDMPGMGLPTPKLPGGTKPAPTAESLIGTWMWDKTVLSDGTISAPKKPSTFSITFSTDGKVNGKTDCNGFFGSYTVGSDGVITFGPIGSTLMYCEGSQEADFTKPFAEVARYSSDATGNLMLLLKDDSGAIVLKRK